MSGAARHRPIPIGVGVFGRDRRLMLHTPGLPALVGVPPRQVAPGTPIEGVLEAVSPGWRYPPNAEPANPPPPMRCRTPDGRIIDVAFETLPRSRLCMTVTDVTETCTIEDDLRRARTAAEVANQAKSRFLATMSHELRTPLNAIIGFSDALEHESEAADAPPIDRGRVLEFAGAIHEAGQYLLTLINNVLDVARIESGRFDLASDLIEVDRLAADCVRVGRPVTEAAEVTLEVILPETLPRIHGDERRLRQVITHLLGNAAKFTHAGGHVVLKVDRAPDGDLLLDVTDNGIGIPDGDLERVFEPFSQLDTGLARKAPGAGLGLYFCRALVQGHGGTLTLRSEPGFGTTATIRLPSRLLVAVSPSLELTQDTP